MNFPNFFIIGAPKCGTTSLANWLSMHPNIYMSTVKEPHFFCTDLNYFNIRSYQEYRRLFQAVKNNHLAAGEASVFYLFSKVAVPRIEKETFNSKYIVMVRNPADMAYSMHDQQIFSGNEHIKDFKRAWEISPERRNGKMVQKFCSEPKLLDYQELCSTGNQIKRLLKNIERERVIILVLEDIKKHPKEEYQKVLNFLEVPDDERSEFPVMNIAKERKWNSLFNLTRHAGVLSKNLKKSLRISEGKGTGILIAIDKINAIIRKRPPLSDEMRNILFEYYKDDMSTLSNILRRDLLKLWMP